MEFLNQLPVSFSDSAWNEILNIIHTKNIPSNYFLRIQVKGAACAGVSFGLGFDVVSESDKIYQYLGFTILIDKKNVMHVSGKKVDFVNNSEAQGFVFVDED